MVRLWHLMPTLTFSATGEGGYKVKRTYASNDTVSIQAFPECQIALNESITER